jgi:hypothetical protein
MEKSVDQGDQRASGPETPIRLAKIDIETVNRDMRELEVALAAMEELYPDLSFQSAVDDLAEQIETCKGFISQANAASSRALAGIRSLAEGPQREDLLSQWIEAAQRLKRNMDATDVGARNLLTAKLILEQEDRDDQEESEDKD